MTWFAAEGQLSREKIVELVHRAAEEARERICKDPKRVLLLPPDITRAHSGAGWITEEFYKIFSKTAEVHLIPTLGQHVPHTDEQNRWMFGSVPLNHIHVHDWRDGSRTIGEVPQDFVEEATKGKANWAIPVSLDNFLLDGKWDLIINVGHVVPHEVLGFANHNKNYFIGLGGKPMICASHMAAACCGIENNLGTLITPLRACYNKAENDYLGGLPDFYFEVVMAYNQQGQLAHTGVFVGDDLDTYLDAARASRRQNITIVPPLRKVVAVMQGDEFYSTWVANKAIYRTRKAMADGGELLIIAPGLKRFGEQDDVDKIIRKYGYTGTENIMKLWKKRPALQDLTHATAHLIHGSSEGRFKITYAPGHLTKQEIESVGFNYADIEVVQEYYKASQMRNGFNELKYERVYYISTPSAGLWTTADKLNND